MAITLAVGTQVSIGSTYGAASAMSAITNANPAVATLAGGHGCEVGDIIEVTSGWDLITARLFRVSVVSTNDVTFEGLNTTSTSLYPAGTGIGSIRRITAFTVLSQLTSGIQVTGGEQQFADVTTLVDRIQRQIPTQRGAISVSLPLFDDPSLAWVPTVRTASETAVATGMRMVFPNGSRLLANAYWSLQEVPTIEDSTLRSQISLAFAAQPTRYAT
jgi:hypothetical protein